MAVVTFQLPGDAAQAKYDGKIVEGRLFGLTDSLFSFFNDYLLLLGCPIKIEIISDGVLLSP
jgi:hypothetical protein